MKKIKPKASCGHDNISSILLKSISFEIHTIITLIINQSIVTGIFPDQLKIAKIKPVYKKDNPHIPDNYRPISLLPAVSKLFEKLFLFRSMTILLIMISYIKANMVSAHFTRQN